ncbi:UDP-N-acetylmuramoyl-L-alanine--D-glutamate ligase [Robiginitalea sp. SC105]|uniref:UDP-N-acetylmuramoyl-L-alanine--D-glutamate ligase n=1 Tax=Robiginitalea sp. SC105 TaxID=2762332 RepID=UPI00163A16FC|nr:UDP-N-acetylmuramoyl-L-alanine--D-glutamate ligase [Robiginitalea sp. SC105]MBC2838983.1 UDP-N-acetylmuramoyl-L-alanine--D-glutamate ligase [Robiginitalea sp. SC105]
MAAGRKPDTARRIDALRQGGLLVVLGSGESGVGAAVLGQKKGFEVFVSDKGAIAEKYKDVLIQTGIDWEEGGHSEGRILGADLCVKSPGIPDGVPIVRQLVEEGIPVISEIEFASWYCGATLIAITGSNGKTTTAMLTYHLLREGGLDVGLAGNIGDSFAGMVARETHAYYVLEVSSFQLDGILGFGPHIAVITNITPDHLDRYGYKMENYIRSKLRITENQGPEDFLLFDRDDPVLSGEMVQGRFAAQLLPLTLEEDPSATGWMEQNELRIQLNNEKSPLKMSTDSLALEGRHNIKNTMAAATVARLVGIRKESIRESVANFQGAPHRLEKVLKIHHVQYINDSKATNVNATFYALDSMSAPTVWIVGGVDKGNDYKPLMPLVREKVKAIICLGTDNSRIVDAFGNAVDLLVETYAMSEAVKVAYKIAERGDTVLLSPACASFDLFKNYEDRGNQFKEAVKAL